MKFEKIIRIRRGIKIPWAGRNQFAIKQKTIKSYFLNLFTRFPNYFKKIRLRLMTLLAGIPSRLTASSPWRIRSTTQRSTRITGATALRYYCMDWPLRSFGKYVFKLDIWFDTNINLKRKKNYTFFCKFLLFIFFPVPGILSNGTLRHGRLSNGRLSNGTLRHSNWGRGRLSNGGLRHSNWDCEMEVNYCFWCHLYHIASVAQLSKAPTFPKSSGAKESWRRTWPFKNW